jgi:hypothetical protein
MAWTQADVDKLESAIASGVQTVTYDGPPRRSITYQTTGDMLRARALMVDEVARTSPSRKSSIRRLATRKGF